VAALSLEVDEEKVTQWQRPGLGIVLGLGLRRLLMYSLDINFIKERPEFKPSRFVQRRRSKLSLPAGNLSPLYLGLGIGLFNGLLVGGGWFLTKPKCPVRTENCPNRRGSKPLGYSRAGNQKNSGTDKSNSSGDQALATVFNQIRPWNGDVARYSRSHSQSGAN